MLILGLLGMYFDAAVVFVTKSSLLFRLALAILWFLFINIAKQNLPNLWLISFLHQIECKCYSSHLKNKERKIKIKLLEVWLITTVTLCQFTSIFTSYCKAYIELHNGAKNINELFLYIQISRLTLKVLDHFTSDVQIAHFQSPYCWPIYQN